MILSHPQPNQIDLLTHYLRHCFPVISFRRKTVEKDWDAEFSRQPDTELLGDLDALLDGHVLDRDEGADIQSSHSRMFSCSQSWIYG